MVRVGSYPGASATLPRNGKGGVGRVGEFRLSGGALWAYRGRAASDKHLLTGHVPGPVIRSALDPFPTPSLRGRVATCAGVRSRMDTHMHPLHRPARWLRRTRYFLSQTRADLGLGGAYAAGLAAGQPVPGQSGPDRDPAARAAPAAGRLRAGPGRPAARRAVGGTDLRAGGDAGRGLPVRHDLPRRPVRRPHLLSTPPWCRESRGRHQATWRWPMRRGAGRCPTCC